jgi:glycosyltransferase involved in cell wall biosynthesis
MPNLSIIIPTYNAEKYIADTIRSALAQTYTDFELLIVDDGSTDRSVEVARKFSDPRVQIIHQENRGLPGARNTGIRQARGQYITFLDADDLWVSSKLEKHIAHFEQELNIGISFSYSMFIDEFGKSLGLYQKPRRLRNIDPAYVLCRNPIGNGSSAVIRREVFAAIEFQDNLHGQLENYYFDERLRHNRADATDVECWLRIAIQTNWQFAGLPEVLTLYRVNSTGLSANSLKQLEALERVIEKTRTYAPDIINASERTAQAYHLRYIARRAVTLRDGKMAMEMMQQAMASDWRILLQEPGRTLLTMAAAYLLNHLPASLYSRTEQFILDLIKMRQNHLVSRG